MSEKQLCWCGKAWNTLLAAIVLLAIGVTSEGPAASYIGTGSMVLGVVALGQYMLESVSPAARREDTDPSKDDDDSK